MVETLSHSPVYNKYYRNVLKQLCYWFLGKFAKLRKVTTIFVMTVCLSFRLEQHGSPWMNFHEI
jgi:hypothetical protein